MTATTSIQVQLFPHTDPSRTRSPFTFSPLKYTLQLGDTRTIGRKQAVIYKQGYIH